MKVFNQTVALSLIASQILLAPLSWATERHAQPTPEFELAKTVIALKGQKLSKEQYRRAISDAGKEYVENLQGFDASSSPSVERMEEALVDLNVYTPQQVRMIDAAIRQDLAKARVSSANEADALMSREVQTLVNLNPAGAEFSGCDLLLVAGATTAISIYGAIAEWSNGNTGTAGYILGGGFTVALLIGLVGVSSCDDV